MILLKQLRSSQKAIKSLRAEYGVSRPQAFRYVQEAGRLGVPVTVPEEEKEMIVVKLPLSIVNRMRMLKRKKKESIVGILTEALGIYLKENGI
jgi:hypothetical protein